MHGIVLCMSLVLGAQTPRGLDGGPSIEFALGGSELPCSASISIADGGCLVTLSTSEVRSGSVLDSDTEETLSCGKSIRQCGVVRTCNCSSSPTFVQGSNVAAQCDDPSVKEALIRLGSGWLGDERIWAEDGEVLWMLNSRGFGSQWGSGSEGALVRLLFVRGDSTARRLVSKMAYSFIFREAGSQECSLVTVGANEMKTVGADELMRRTKRAACARFAGDLEKSGAMSPNFHHWNEVEKALAN